MIETDIFKILKKVEDIGKKLDTELFDLLEFYDLTIQSYSLKKNWNNRYAEYLKEKNDSHTEGVTELVDEQNDRINRYPTIVLKTGFIYAVSQFEAFWSDILRVIFKMNYREFLKSNKKVTYEYLLQINNTKTIIENLIDKEVKSFGYDSMKVQVEKINKKLVLRSEI